MAEALIIPPSQLFVNWDCKRCGHKNGVAQTTIPVAGWNETMMRELLLGLKAKLVQIHARSDNHRGQRCIATPEDFIVRRVTDPAYLTPGKKIVGLL
jgi:hypothetical protein